MNENRKIFIKILGEVQNTITFNLRKSSSHQTVSNISIKKEKDKSRVVKQGCEKKYLFQLHFKIFQQTVKINKTKLTWFKVSLLFSSQTSNNAFIRFKFDNGGQESTIPPLTEYTSDQFSSIQRRGESSNLSISCNNVNSTSSINIHLYTSTNLPSTNLR